jgi:hypothetical protein
VRWVAPALSAATSSSVLSCFLPRPGILRFALARRLLSSAGLLSRMSGVEDEFVSACCEVAVLLAALIIAVYFLVGAVDQGQDYWDVHLQSSLRCTPTR